MMAIFDLFQKSGTSLLHCPQRGSMVFGVLIGHYCSRMIISEKLDVPYQHAVCRNAIVIRCAVSHCPWHIHTPAVSDVHALQRCDISINQYAYRPFLCPCRQRIVAVEVSLVALLEEISLRIAGRRQQLTLVMHEHGVGV